MGKSECIVCINFVLRVFCEDFFALSTKLQGCWNGNNITILCAFTVGIGPMEVTIIYAHA